MGRFNSSLTRVVPVFNALMDKDPTGRTWLAQLIGMGSRSAEVPASADVGELSPCHPRWWGENERRLTPPSSLLRWQISNLEAPERPADWGGPEARAKRERLVQKDPYTVAEALALLGTTGLRRGAWYVFEGNSQPDAYLESSNAILVIEGKRTERKATTGTTWMRTRSQILRHMDAAWEIRGDKSILGLMLVEGESELPDEVNPHWRAEAEKQISDAMVAASLPHRGPTEREGIVGGFLGAATWHRVCSELCPRAIDFGPG